MPFLATPLDELLGTRARVRLLRVLLGREQALTGRELARLAGMASAPAMSAIAPLVARGIVRRTDVGRAAHFLVERDHPLVVTLLTPLFASERQWSGQLFALIGAWLHDVEAAAASPVLWAGLFGSVVRGDDDAHSDLDVAVVVETEAQAEAIRAAMADAPTSPVVARLSPVVLSAIQLRRLAMQPHSLASTLRDSARRLYGTVELATLL